MTLLFLEGYDSYVTWPFMGGSAIAYLLSLAVLKQLMQGKEKYKLEAFSKVYNLSQIILCGYMTWGFFTYGFSLENPFGLNSPFTKEIEWFMFVHYVSKFLDFVDSWIMILKQNFRQLTFLHVYHHSSILLVWGFLLQLGQASGTAYFGAFLNSLVHLLMYSHYLYTSFGFVNPLKKWVTYIQLIQFFLCICHAVLTIFYETVLMKELAYLQFGYHLTMIYLFSQFFKETYLKKDPAGLNPFSDSN